MAKTKAQTKKKIEIKLTDMTPMELTIEAKDLKTKIARTRLEVAVGKAKDLRQVFNMRKKLARVLTALNAKI